MIEKPGESRHSALGLGLLVFAAGAGLMCVEIISGMTIAPYFGSNVFVWGSVIAVFMGALSVGYLLGGRAASRGAGMGTLLVLAAGAGALVCLVPLTGPPLCRLLLSLDLPAGLNRLRPLAALTLLYFLPGMLLGMISPVAVRVASTALARVGRAVGGLYALNTLGALLGALAGTFVLVVWFGNRVILLLCGGGLFLSAAACGWIERGVRAAGAVPRPKAAPPSPGLRVPGLRLLVFGCGMVLMSLQVIGGAVIAPFFGSSVFVWGSVITVFLGALSLGYFLGGKLADRRPSMMSLATVVVAAGIAILVIPLVAPPVCRAFLGSSANAGLDVLRPLFASAILYLVPVVLLAMVAPFAVRLATAQLGGVGRAAGRLYALSTLGNVTGVLLTTFVLISAIGKTNLLSAAGGAAVLVAVAAVLVHRRARDEGRPPYVVSALLLAAVAALALMPKPALVPIADADEEIFGSYPGGWTVVRYEYSDASYYHVLRRIRAQRESPYHHLAVIEHKPLPTGVRLTTLEGDVFTVAYTIDAPRRDLKFDQYVESAVLLTDDAAAIRRPYTSGTTYSDLLHLPLLFRPDARNVLIIGGGGGVVPMVFKRCYPQMSIDIVEIDPVVVEVAQKWFGLELDERVRMHVRDGRMFVHNAKKKYDLILLDAYTAGGRIPAHLTTREFLSEVRDHLAPRGVALMNVISGVQGRLSKLFRAEYKTFRAVFDPHGLDTPLRESRVYVFPKTFDEDGTASTNVILVATTDPQAHRLTPAQAEARARRLLARGRLKMPTAPSYAGRMLSTGFLADLPQDDVPVLTDDYAPVDFWVVELAR